MRRIPIQREIPEPTHTDRPLFYGVERATTKQPMTEVIALAIKGFQARYGAEQGPKYLLCHTGLGAELGAEHQGMQVLPKPYVHPTVVYCGANPPSENAV